jgi:threonine/homoserine/homoserine lactone efflux protein
VFVIELLLMVASVHFLSLVSPGPDFFLIIRTSVAHGWRMAVGVCVGIALANAVFIVGAFTGLAMFRADSIWFVIVQCAGCLYLLYIGQLFIRYAGRQTDAIDVEGVSSGVNRQSARKTWWRHVGMGLMSGLLNPKNALFYISLATILLVRDIGVVWMLLIGLWMFLIVLVWDIGVAVALGNVRLRRRFMHQLPWIERVAGVVLIVMAMSVLMVMMISLFKGD